MMDAGATLALHEGLVGPGEEIRSSPRSIDGEIARGQENRPVRRRVAVLPGDGAAQRSVDRVRGDDGGDEAIFPPLHERTGA